MSRIICGIDVTKLPDVYGGCVPGRTLILDGDGPAYRAAATSKRLDAAIRKYQSAILTEIFMTQSQDCEIHLTCPRSKKAGRYNIIGVKPYQGQRKGKDKPALLEPLRQAMQHRSNWLPEFEVFTHTDIEADDAMIMRAHALKENGLIWSDDKDLRMTPYPYWDMSLGIVEGCEPEGWIARQFTPAGNLKIVGRGPKFFWTQMLMGDTADNIQGIVKYDGKLCGPAGAYDILHPVTGLDNIANCVLDGYRSGDQNPLPEGWFLHLLRWRGDNFYKYLQELRLSSANAKFIEDCTKREWFRKPEAAEPEDPNA